MKLSLADLPLEVKAAYLGSLLKPEEIEGLRGMEAMDEIESLAIIDSANALIYVTRDGGDSFEIERIAETISLKGHQSRDEGIVVRRVIRISERAGGV